MQDIKTPETFLSFLGKKSDGHYIQKRYYANS